MTKSGQVAGLLLLAALALGGCKEQSAPAPAPESTTKAASTSAPAAADAPLPVPAPDLEKELAGVAGLPFDRDSSKIEFVGANVTRRHNGGFKRVDGRLELHGRVPEKVTVVIDMQSTQVDHPKLERHLKGPDFFDVDRFPIARFVSTSIEEGGDGAITHVITGELTLHGQTRTVSFPITLAGSPEAIEVTGTFDLNRKDFGIMYEGAADNLVRDEVPIKIAVVVPRKEATP